MSDPAVSAGPNADGSNHLASESKAGLAVAFIGTAVLDGLINALTDLDTSSWGGTWSTVGAAAVSTVIGLLVAYKKRNRRAFTR